MKAKNVTYTYSQAFYGPSEFVNLTLSLLLLTITYANRMFKIFNIVVVFRDYSFS